MRPISGLYSCLTHDRWSYDFRPNEYAVLPSSHEINFIFSNLSEDMISDRGNGIIVIWHISDEGFEE
jgi:hypothetical protein